MPLRIRSGRPATALVLAFLAAGCASLVSPPPLPPVAPGIVGRRLSRAAAIEDIDTLLMIYQRVHVNLYANVSRDSVSRLRDLLVASLPDSVSRVELWLGLDRIATSFGDGHTTLEPPVNEVIRAVARGDMLFPIRVALDETGALVVASAPDVDTILAPGDRVLSINGYPADSLLLLLAGQISGEASSMRLEIATSGFAGRLWLNGVRAPFVVRIRNASGVEREESFPVRPRAPKMNRQATRSTDSVGLAEAPGGASGTGFRYQLLPDRVGYLDYYSMEGDLGVFRAQIAKAFTRMGTDSVRVLVIDLRRNGGGNSLLGDALLAHFNDRPYRQDSRKAWRMSREYRGYLKSAIPGFIRWFGLEYAWPAGRRLFSGPDGRVVTFNWPIHAASRAAPFFSGPVCILIGPATFSSATDLAAAVKDFHLATLIGEETGGRANSFGEVYPFLLPNSRVLAGVSSAYFVRASGDTTGHGGVRPDVEIRRTSEDARAARDPVLESARNCPTRPAATGTEPR